ncbi:DUF1801 domain-containing protein [Emticicia sp. 21SJ11W-3]|uniref:DUF1801 domain-containing protein n=1 Tax=Emticicia sp. 21SJ11W-3 TaxID=2916755 RepID=UPI00209E5D66|nr:DUF1801 domain-containing protein [Emticicia sp. 21SJ11W-3]UTA69931.1 DUF1801 domain-containing protein [Emticicia sp. 21SJ11W-3]
MAKNKTSETAIKVEDFLNQITEEKRKTDGFQLLQIMSQQTGLEARMWGPSIIGFGSYHYKYDSGHEGDAPLVAFSPRKDAISLYTYLDPDKREALLQKLGKHKTGKGCIYIKNMADISMDVLREMIDESVRVSRLKDISNS